MYFPVIIYVGIMNTTNTLIYAVSMNTYIYNICLIACAGNTVFLLINAPGAMQNIDREPLLCTQFTKQKVCPTVSAVQVF